MLLRGLAEAARCVICLRTGQWPQRLHDVEELEKVILEQKAHERGKWHDRPQLGVFMLALFVVAIMLGFPSPSR